MGFVGQLVLQYTDKVKVIETGPDWKAQVPEKDWSTAHTEKEYGQGPWNKVLHSRRYTGWENRTRASGTGISSRQ